MTLRGPAKTTRGDFDNWVEHMDDALDQFLEGPAAPIQESLDFSPRSLDALERWIIENYPNTDALRKAEQAPVVDGAGRYIGETFRKAIGGHWDIDLDNPKNAYFGLPVLTGFEPKPTPVCPMVLATASANRRTGTYIRTILENVMKRLSNGKAGGH